MDLRRVLSLLVLLEAAASAAGQSTTPAWAQQDLPPNNGPAKECQPPTLPRWQPAGVPRPPLPPGKRPNFIVVLTDDQGWDDIGLNQPGSSSSNNSGSSDGGGGAFVRTPNLDRFIRGGTFFDNFYVAPQCSLSRAQLLTGRDYARTGAMLVNGGYDYLSRAEATAGDVFGAAGYRTAHFGKWHNGRTLGYEPWQMGFNESWFPNLYVNLDNLMRYNGHYVQTYGLMEQDLMDRALGWVEERARDSEPFYLYYAPNAIHQGYLRKGEGERWQRPAPEPYISKYRALAASNAIDGATAQVWAFLEYMDDVLGRLFGFLEQNPDIADSTYVLVMSDNGSELFQSEYLTARKKLTRMPSGMAGWKRFATEGGVRNYLAVQGPGVPAGVVDSTLVSIDDILPTTAALAGINGSSGSNGSSGGGISSGITSSSGSGGSSAGVGSANTTTASNGVPETPGDDEEEENNNNDDDDISNNNSDEEDAAVAAGRHHPWTGLDLSNLLVGPAAAASAAAGGPGAAPLAGAAGPSWPSDRGGRGAALASAEQRDRFVFSLSPLCWEPDAVPELDARRRVVRPQPLLDFDAGGARNWFDLPSGADPYGGVAGSPTIDRSGRAVAAVAVAVASSSPVGGGVAGAAANATNNGTAGGGTGFARCIGVRYRDYKWLGATGKAYRLARGSHVEAPCSEVGGPEGAELAALMERAARDWWASMVLEEPHSFEKPTFLLGFRNWSVTNVLPDGAHDRTPGRVRLLPSGASGWERPGDRACWKARVDAPGWYEVLPVYQSTADATFRVSFGTFDAIQRAGGNSSNGSSNDASGSGGVASVTAVLPQLGEMAGRVMGYVNLTRSARRAWDGANGSNSSNSSSNSSSSSSAPPPDEVCLELLSSTDPEQRPVLQQLGVLRLTRMPAGFVPPPPPPPPPPQEPAEPPPRVLPDTLGFFRDAALWFGPARERGPAAAAAPPAGSRGRGADDASRGGGGGGGDLAPPAAAANPTALFRSILVAAAAGSSSSSGGGGQGTTTPATDALLRQLHPRLGATPAMRRVERDAIASAAAFERRRAVAAAKERGAEDGGGWPGALMTAAAASSSSSSSSRTDDDKVSRWHEARRAQLWPPGQGRVFESMFSPYAAEAIQSCPACWPNLT